MGDVPRQGEERRRKRVRRGEGEGNGGADKAIQRPRTRQGWQRQSGQRNTKKRAGG